MAAKINISLDESLLAQMDEYAVENHLSRSAAFAFAAAQFLRTQLKSEITRSVLEEMCSILSDSLVSDELEKEGIDYRLDSIKHQLHALNP